MIQQSGNAPRREEWRTHDLPSDGDPFSAVDLVCLAEVGSDVVLFLRIVCLPKLWGMFVHIGVGWGLADRLVHVFVGIVAGRVFIFRALELFVYVLILVFLTVHSGIVRLLCIIIGAVSVAVVQ